MASSSDNIFKRCDSSRSCEGFARADHWYLPVETRLEEGVEGLLLGKLKGIADG